MKWRYINYYTKYINEITKNKLYWKKLIKYIINILNIYQNILDTYFIF